MSLKILEFLTKDLESHFDLIFILKLFITLTIFYLLGRLKIKNSNLFAQHVLAPL